MPIVSSVAKSLPPSGTASGDLSGTYPGPTVAKVNGIAVTGTPSTGFVPTATSASAATWQAAGGTYSLIGPYTVAWNDTFDGYGYRLVATLPASKLIVRVLAFVTATWEQNPASGNISFALFGGSGVAYNNSGTMLYADNIRTINTADAQAYSIRDTTGQPIGNGGYRTASGTGFWVQVYPDSGPLVSGSAVVYAVAAAL